MGRGETTAGVGDINALLLLCIRIYNKNKTSIGSRLNVKKIVLCAREEGMFSDKTPGGGQRIAMVLLPFESLSLI